jgi:hypothetical protein
MEGIAMKKLIQILMVLVMFNFVDCRKTTTEPLTLSTPGFLASDFPNSVGSKWTYATYDSISQMRDTVEVSILGTIPLPNATLATQWQYKYSSRVDTLTVVQYSDTIEFRSYTLVPTFIFPLQVGNGWGTQDVDTFTVALQDTISVPVGSFSSYRVDQQSLLPNDGSFFQYWVAPKVGIVKQFQRQFLTISPKRTKTTWILLSYSIQ